MVPPVDPLERGQLEVVDAPPRALAMHEFGLVEPDRGLREGVTVVRMTDGADRGHGAGGAEAFGVADGQKCTPRSE